jgi:predicted dehydrogenase
MVWDMSCHHMDSLLCWLGPAKRVTARSYSAPWTQYTYDPNISAFIEYKSGAVCNYVLTHDANIAQWRIVLQGDRGALVLTDHERLQFYPKPGQQLGHSEPVECDLMDCLAPHEAIVDEFFRYVVENVEPGISGKNNLRTMAICEALVRSAKNKKPVEMDELK